MNLYTYKLMKYKHRFLFYIMLDYNMLDKKYFNLF